VNSSTSAGVRGRFRGGPPNSPSNDEDDDDDDDEDDEEAGGLDGVGAAELSARIGTAAAMWDLHTAHSFIHSDQNGGSSGRASGCTAGRKRGSSTYVGRSAMGSAQRLTDSRTAGTAMVGANAHDDRSR
jgi:hypothetical protein